MSMKGVVTVVGIVIILVVVGLFVFRSTDEVQAPSLEPTFEMRDGGLPDNESGLFIKLAPSDLPVSESDVSEEGAVSNVGDTDVVSNVVSDVTISVDESGFTPSEVEISVGDTIQFVNDGQALHWPRSDIFDAGSGLATGGIFSHTFVEAGVWEFNDHLYPGVHGTVTVK